MCRKIVRQATEIRDDFRVELTLRGEPTLNPRLLTNLKIIREEAPKFQISLFTNGVKILKRPKLVKKILDAGVNILCIDCYNNTYDRFEKLAKDSGEKTVDFRTFTAYKRHKDGYKLRVVNLVPDLPTGEVRVRKIHNNAGNVSTDYLDTIDGYVHPPLPLVKRCGRPFRELVVYCTGDVVLCCHDWQAESVIGSVEDHTLHQLWYGKRHLELLQRLYDKDRAMSPCKSCDYFGGYRLGLLKNPH